MTPRRAPERTCVGCRGKAGKGDLVRLARRPDAGVRVDVSGVSPGRGAYVHRDAECIEAALRRGVLGRALRTGVSAEEAVRLRTDLEREVGR